MVTTQELQAVFIGNGNRTFAFIRLNSSKVEESIPRKMFECLGTGGRILCLSPTSNHGATEILDSNGIGGDFNRLSFSLQLDNYV